MTPITIVPNAFIHITNVSLDEELQGPDTRTVLRLHTPSLHSEEDLATVLCSLGAGVSTVLLCFNHCFSPLFSAGAISAKPHP